MPEKKKQHYIPKFYMREFANEEGKFSIYHLGQEKCISLVPYDDQCQKDYYYGADRIWENRLDELETKWAIVIKKMLKHEPIGESDIKLIKQFALYQRQRTFAEGEYKEQERIDLLIECGKMLYAHKGWNFDEEAERICKERALDEIAPAENLEIAMKFANIIDDLHMLVITYNTHTELISSDVPVIAINPFHKYTIGYGCMGLILLFPISRHKVVVLYDAKMYPRHRGATYIELNNENEVHNLNALQYVSAEKVLFAYDSNSFSGIASEARVARENCRGASPISTLGPEGNKVLMTSMRQALYDCELSFAQISHKFKRIPFTCREAAPRKWEKGWEEKFKTKEQIMPLIMSENPSAFSHSGLTIKELRRGCRRMTDAVQVYWQTSL